MRKITLLLLICCYSASLYAQNPQDCPTGIQVCQPVYTQANSYTGYGTINELFTQNDGCMYQDPGEKNSVWYIITVTAPGTFLFMLTPNQLSTDYDWGLWDITNGGCSEIYNYATNTPNAYGPIRCNTSGTPGLTGMTATACCPSELAGSVPFCSQLTVTAGQVFALCVDNYTQNTSGYTLDFSASTASIFDTTHPRFDTIGTYCGATDSISFGMSEAVKCSSLANNGSNFSITPAAATPILATGLSCGGATGTTTTFIGVKFSASLPPGNYVLHAQNGTNGTTLLDYCNSPQLVGDSISFTIAAPPILSLAATDTICLTDPAQLNVTVTNPTPGATYTYQWSPNQYINNTAIANPVVSPPANMPYYVTVYQSGAVSCSSMDTINIAVLPNDFSLFNHDTAICIGASVQVNASGSPLFSYMWAPDFGVSNPAIIDPLITITTDTTNTYTVTANFPGCPPMSHGFSISVVTPSPTIPISRTTCVGVPVQFDVTAPENEPFEYSWSPATYLSNDTIPNPVDNPTAGGDITYIVTVKPVAAGCYTYDTVHLQVWPSVKVIAYPADTTILYGNSIQINTINPDADTLFYFWIPDNGTLNNTSISNPIASPTDSTTYIVIAMDAYGCRDTETVRVAIDYAMNEFVPNAFSPNGDTKNDVFRIGNIKYQKLIDFSVFNRWGQMVFHTTTPDQGWDGTFNGVPQEVGTYNYMISIIRPDGTEKLYRGDVILIR